MSFFENTRKPVGLGGKIMVAMMNFGHSAMAAWGLRFLQPAPDAMVLDCGCGGGANIKTLLKRCPKGKVQGIDYSAVSVEKARKVNAGAIAAGQCTVQQASVAELPFEAEQFDVATAFETVYFWPELAQNFREVYRVLKPGGKVVILEFSTPRNPLFRRVYGLYSHRLLPAIGGMISKDRKAYEYLPASVDEFPAPECFMAMMREAGFKDCRARSQSLGIAQIYTGEK